ncbi:dihydroneopterin aldolase [Leuconostoc citreum]
MGMIKLPNMRFYTYNGVFDEEKKLGQQISVDVVIHYPIETAVRDDDLNTTISYVDIYELVKDVTTQQSFNLMESLANAILMALLKQWHTC